MNRWFEDFCKGDIMANEGWECPRCNKINAPDIKECDCVKRESKSENSMQDINESR